MWSFMCVSVSVVVVQFFFIYVSLALLTHSPAISGCASVSVFFNVTLQLYGVHEQLRNKAFNKINSKNNNNAYIK